MNVLTFDVETTHVEKPGGGYTPLPYFGNRLVSIGYKWLVSGVATEASASLEASLVCTNASWTVQVAEGPASRDGTVGQKMVSAVVCPSGMVVGGGCTGSGIVLTESVPTVYEGNSSAWACGGRVLEPG